MEIGPFEIKESSQVEKLLEKHSIAYDISVDDALKESILQEYHEKAQRGFYNIAPGALDLRYIYFTLDEKDYLKIIPELEHYGLSFCPDNALELED